MNRSAFLFFAGAAVLSGCSSVSVNRDYDSAFDFSTLKTYAWRHAVQPETGVPRIDNDLNDQRIRRAVDAELKAKGFLPAADTASADFQVEYFMDFQQRIESTGGTVSVGMGRSTASRAGMVGWSSAPTVSDYEEVQLTIDIINPETGRMVWRGRGRRRVSGSARPEKLTGLTNDAVSRILKKFPPKPR